MTSLFRKVRVKLSQQTGAATLLLSVLLTSVIALIVLAAAMFTWYSQKMTSNQLRGTMAYEAAEAGLDYAIPYFQNNRETIIANTTSGFIDPYSDSNTSATLDNGSSYTFSYTNPVANDYDLILVTSTGTSDDSSASRSVSQLIQIASIMLTTPNVSVASKGNINLTGSTQITNTDTNVNLQSGGSVSLDGSSETITSGGVTSNSSGTGSDIVQNDTDLASQTNDEMFISYFGASPDSFKSSATTSLSGSGNTNYNSDLDGKTNEIIWIEQDGGEARLSSTTQVGTAADPVIMIVNGDLKLSGSVKIYGVLFVIGSSTTDITGNIEIHGTYITTGDANFAGNATVNFEPAIFTEIGSTFTRVGKVPGSWRDF